MAKAFSDEEKEVIREKILEVSLDLFHESGTKSLSIAEVTKRVGIAQGSFYNFWKDKDALILDVMSYRLVQKLNLLEKRFSDSLANPADFIAHIIYNNALDLRDKAKKKKIYADAFKIFTNKNDKMVGHLESVYQSFLDKLIKFWLENQAIKSADKKGLINVIIGVHVLCMNANQFSEDYFNEILKIYTFNTIKYYILIQE